MCEYCIEPQRTRSPEKEARDREIRDRLHSLIKADLEKASAKVRRLLDCGCPRYSRFPGIDRVLRYLFPPPVHHH